MPCKKQRDYPNRHEVYRAEYGNIDFSYGKGGDEAAALIEKLLSALEDKDEEIDWKVMRIYKDTVGKLIDVESPDGVIDVLPEKWCKLWEEKEHWKNMFDEMTKKKDDDKEIIHSQMDKKLSSMDEEIYRLHEGWMTKKDKEIERLKKDIILQVSVLSEQGKLLVERLDKINLLCAERDKWEKEYFQIHDELDQKTIELNKLLQCLDEKDKEIFDYEHGHLTVGMNDGRFWFKTGKVAWLLTEEEMKIIGNPISLGDRWIYSLTRIDNGRKPSK